MSQNVGEFQPRGVRGVDYTKSIQNKLYKFLRSTTGNFFAKCLHTSTKSHVHHQCVHNNSAKFGECQPKGVRGVDYTKYVPYMKTPTRPAFTILHAGCIFV
jgi:hypothetical protein